MLHYKQLSPEVERAIKEKSTPALSPFAFPNEEAERRENDKDKPTLIRPAFIRDIDKILHCPYFNRYADKTQVFSFYKNDDISRRGLHVQLVSRIARTIGSVLGLNLDLIEAIALGHDMGHTPFGHVGESYLDELLCAHTGRHFSHNIHSIRVLDTLYPCNLTLQTLDGIACHDGEFEKSKYVPAKELSFTSFDDAIEACYKDTAAKKRMIAATLEGCVMRISDIIAYLGKDRQDAERANIVSHNAFSQTEIGTYNAEIINNLVVNIIENSFEKPYIQMDGSHFTALKTLKDENYQKIYKDKKVRRQMNEIVRPMMENIYKKLLEDLQNGRRSSPIFTHHIDFVEKTPYKRSLPYVETEPNQLVVDFIASMTDDYFIDLHAYLFPHSPLKVEYIGYFA